MTEVTKYIADDGTEFDSSLECAEYENRNVRFFNSNGSEVKFSSDDNFFADISKIIINDENQYKAFKETIEFYDWYFDEIDQPGTWVWAHELDKFIRVDDILNDYVGQLKWERDVAMETLKDIGIPFGHKYKDITYEMGINLIAKLLNEGNARVIQTGGFTE